LSPLIHQLVAAMPDVNVYPHDVVVPITPKLRGRSFFPGGCGLFGGVAQRLADRPIMLVGQDFGTLDYWNGLNTDDESWQGTWTSLRKMLLEVEVDPRNCFFTNVLLGVRRSGPIDGPSPALRCPDYVSACSEYVKEQVGIVQPSVVVALGKVPTILLARCFGLTSSLSAPTEDDSKNATFEQIDNQGLQFRESVSLSSSRTFAFASSVHPDRFWLHYRHRHWPEKKTRGRPCHDLIWQEIRRASGR